MRNSYLNRFWIGIVLTFAAVGNAPAHEVRPGYLELRQLDGHIWEILWRVPHREGTLLPLSLRLPDDCQEQGRSVRSTSGATDTRLRVLCPSGLTGWHASIDGLALQRSNVLARAFLNDGSDRTVLLTPDQPDLVLQPKQDQVEVGINYLRLGVEHILLGFDHLLFVLALMLLVRGRRKLILTITAFTLGHSVTLVAAVVGWVQADVGLVELLVALSIAIVAVEVIHLRRGRMGLGARWPAVFAVGFGLLHGLGFASALRTLGLPVHDIPLALFSFNLGVELGQLIFVLSVVLVAHQTRLAPTRQGPDGRLSHTDRLTLPAAYLIGTIAMYWAVERSWSLWA